ncbi:hypothetical protein CN941_29415 [Bacillus cereus]|nr:hypothetical protein CN941_29415 [Bacillus cereus]
MNPHPYVKQFSSYLVKNKLNDSSQISNQYTSYFQRIRILDTTILQLLDRQFRMFLCALNKTSPFLNVRN